MMQQKEIDVRYNALYKSELSLILTDKTGVTYKHQLERSPMGCKLSHP
jgi:hypothetical protein